MRITHPKLTELQTATATFCGGICRNVRVGRLLCVTGNTGSGKTRVAELVMKWFHHVAPTLQYAVDDDWRIPEVMFIRWPDFKKRTCGAYGTVETGLALMKRACRVDFLVADELMPGSHPDRVDTSNLCDILSAREKKWTFATSNVLPDGFVAAWDARVNSRMYRNGAVVLNLKDVPDFASL
jgi:energy-coupling factor transporter ATP-binding protein EcfA2